MRILLGISPQHGQVLLHRAAVEGKGRGLDLHFVLLQMPERWDTKEAPPQLPLCKHSASPDPKAASSCLRGVRRAVLVRTCGGTAAVETCMLHQRAHSAGVFCCCLLSGGFLPVSDGCICILPFSMLSHSLGPLCSLIHNF